MNGDFEVNPVNLLALSNDYDSIIQQCNSLAASLDGIKNNLRYGSFDSVKSVLNTIAGDVRNEAADVSNLKSSLENIAHAYQAAENAILQTKVNGMTDSSIATDTESAIDSEDSEESAWLDEIWDLIGGAGSIPTALLPYIRMILSNKTGEEIDATILADILNSSINQFAFFTDVAESGWKEAVQNAIGVSAYMPKGTKAGLTFMEYFETALGKELDEFVDFATVGKGTSSIAKWGGVAISGITEGVENYMEYESGGISAERAVAETVIETGVDVGLGIVATAAVGAAFAAAGVVAAPAILVAGIGTGIVVGANYIFEKATGKDLGENISDKICDAGSSIASWFKSL